MISARAVLITKWNKHGYRPLSIPSVETFDIDGAMDSDSDTWTFEIGDPSHELINVLRRDNEVRANIFAVTERAVEPLHSGFADEIMLSENNVLVFSGRDISAPAVDSIAPPKQFRGMKPEQIVSREARALKIGGRLRLQPGPAMGRISRDGSETYWEFWHRFYRKRAMWIWAGADGSLHAGHLNYNQKPAYQFGYPTRRHTGQKKLGWIAVERVELRKSTTSRVGEVWVLGEHGGNPFIAKAYDVTTAEWVKRPNKLIQSSQAKNIREAKAEAWLEVFESKVGALEITLTVADPGYLIRQNRMALLNIPEVGLTGKWFVVGSRYVGGAEGLYQVVRLREKGYALSRRVPADPQAPQEPNRNTSNTFGASLDVPFGNFFVNAARKHHGPWDFNLFLACLLAMGQMESGHQNKREGGSEIYYHWKARATRGAGRNPNDPGYGNQEDQHGRTKREWQELFANDPGNPLNPFSRDAGVGVMQLTTHSFKVAADKMNGGKVDEYTGNRWNPEWNIMEAAAVLLGKLSGIPPGGNNIYLGVKAYNGSGPAAERYAREVRKLVEETYLPKVEEGIQSANQQAGEFTPPLETPMPTQSNFRQIDPEGAPDNNGVRHHAAVDWFAPAHSDVFAPRNGKIVEITRNSDNSGQVFGGVVKMKERRSSRVWVFRHVDPRPRLRVGQQVEAGERLAEVSDWRSGSPHCHIEIWKTLSGGYDFENMIDPLVYMGAD